jgi:uncharacterized membrane protein YhaH (DUF805 family)
MTSRLATFVTVVLVLAFVADTGWQVYRLTQNQPSQWWGMLLLIPILWLLQRTVGGAQPSAGKSSTPP